MHFKLVEEKCYVLHYNYFILYRLTYVFSIIALRNLVIFVMKATYGNTQMQITIL